MGEAPYGVLGTLFAHPGETQVDGGIKQLNVLDLFAVALANDPHGTTGAVIGSTTITAPGILLQDYETRLQVMTNPGNNDQREPVHTLGIVTDPVVVGPEITPFSGSFTMDILLMASAG